LGVGFAGFVHREQGGLEDLFDFGPLRFHGGILSQAPNIREWFVVINSADAHKKYETALPLWSRQNHSPRTASDD